MVSEVFLYTALLYQETNTRNTNVVILLVDIIRSSLKKNNGVIFLFNLLLCASNEIEP